MEVTYKQHRIYITEDKTTSKGTVLHLHGLPGGPVADYSNLHSLFVPRGYRMISFNYPGLWKADGYFSVENAITSTQDVLEYIQSKYEGKIKIFAESFGGSIIAYSLKRIGDVSHIFYRAPLPGIEYFTKNQAKLPLLIQSMAMLIQAEILSIESDSFADAMVKIDVKPIRECVKQLSQMGIKQMTVTGKNDEILDYKAITNGFAETNIEIYDNLSHNAISREQWVELVTKADIFYQQ